MEKVGFENSHFRSLLLLLACTLAVSGEVQFTVEEPSRDTSYLLTSKHQRPHRVRHSKDVSLMSTSEPSIHQSKSKAPESFALNCPHVADASNRDVRLEVAWTLDDTIWLKINDGEKRIVNRLTSFNKRTIAGKTVLRVTLNDGRYWFDYDELTGDFAMEISPVKSEEDAGMWQCLVTVHHEGQTHTLTSRSRIKGTAMHAPRQHYSSTLIDRRPSADAYKPVRMTEPKQDKFLIQGSSSGKISLFSRPDQHSVQISRDTTDKRRQTVVFDRSATAPSSSISARLAAVDYELSMIEDEENDDFRFSSEPRTKPRSAYWNSANHLYFLCLHTLICAVFYIVIR